MCLGITERNRKVSSGMEGFKDFLNESSLSRIWQKTQDYDTGAMTAFRGEFTRSQNQDRNKKVLAYLLNAGYSVTSVKGSYIENHGSSTAREVGEESFFVVDHEKTGKLKDDLVKLGKLYDQDSILWVQKGRPGVLIGTSSRENAFPGMGKTETVGKPIFGQATGQFFSRVKGRQFAFESVTEVKDMLPPDNINGKWAMAKMADGLREDMEQNGVHMS